jgi:hypothetical protein
MPNLSMPLIALAAVYSYSVLAGSLLMASHAARVSAAFIAAPLLALPLLVPGDRLQGRALVAFFCVDAALKIVDYGRELRRGRPARWPEYLWFLVPIPLLLVRLRERRWLTEPAGWRNVRQALLAAAVVGAIFFLMWPVSYIQVVRENFWLDHVVKVAMFVVLIEAGGYLLQGVEQLLGFDTTRPMRSFFLSLTPAEFWSRYNTRVHSWLEANVYRPCGGRIRGVLAVFFFSAVLHELMFDIATAQPDGYQFTFFILQAPAVIASPWLKRQADRYGHIGHATVRALTIGWFVVTSIFFFRGVDRIFPITYASEPWLP